GHTVSCCHRKQPSRGSRISTSCVRSSPRPRCPLKGPLPMHLAQRAYVLVLLTAVLCVVGIWSDEPALAYLWHIPAALLLLGLALEGWFIGRLPLEAQLSSAPRAFLGRPQPATFQFANASPRPLAVHYTPAVPAGFETLARVRRVRIAARGTVRDPVTLLPVRLGPQRWP